MGEHTPQGLIETQRKDWPLRNQPDPVFDFASFVVKARLYSELHYNCFLIPKTIFARMENGEAKGGE